MGELLQRESATIENLVAIKLRGAQKRTLLTYTQQDHVFFDQGISKLYALAVESLGGIGKYGEELLDQVVTSVAGDHEGRKLSQRRVHLTCFKQVISATTQVPYPGRYNGTAWRYEEDTKLHGRFLTLGRGHKV